MSKKQEQEHTFQPGVYKDKQGNKYIAIYKTTVTIDKTEQEIVIYYPESEKDNKLAEVKSEFLKKMKFEKEIPTEEDFESKYKRALADYHNLLQKTEQEKQDAYKYSNESLILEMLPVYDHLKLSIQNLTPEQKDNPWVEGVKYVIKQFKEVLENNGVEEIEVEGKEFDPHTMEAVEDPSQAEESSESESDSDQKQETKGVCKKLVKPGYKLKDKVITPAKVIVE